MDACVWMQVIIICAEPVLAAALTCRGGLREDANLDCEHLSLGSRVAERSAIYSARFTGAQPGDSW